MKKYFFTVSLLFVALAAPAALRADSTYYLVGQDVNGYDITGTITTDGTMGSLNFTDISSFSFGVQSPSTATGGTGSTTSENGKTPDVSNTGNALTATASGLFFNFDSTTPSTLIFQNALDGFEWCLFTDEGCDPPGSGESLSLGSVTGDVTGLSGNVMFASSSPIAPAPEPATSGFVLIGIAGSLLASRKRPLPGNSSVN
jgi:hypothetical protein